MWSTGGQKRKWGEKLPPAMGSASQVQPQLRHLRAIFV